MVSSIRSVSKRGSASRNNTPIVSQSGFSFFNFWSILIEVKKTRLILNFVILGALLGAALIVVWPNGVHWKVKIKGKERTIIDKNYDVKRGLDLQGGARLTYAADLSKIKEEERQNAMNALAGVIENRVNRFGVSEPLVQTSKYGGENRVVVELPGVKNSNDAINSIGKVAELEFKELNESGQDFKSTGLTGKDLKSATADFDPQNGSAIIRLDFNSDGAKKFAEITERNVGKPLATYLDGELIQYPNVKEKITGGSAVVSGIKDIKEAKDLARLLNAGALPAPVKLIEQRTVGATLGQESVEASVLAGILGVLFVSLFMLAYYRLLGVFSTIGLGLYLVFTLALIKVVGITLTMGGIAGLILSIGMSMETDVLVFERIREELRKGRSFEAATIYGFKNAWPSIKDSNAVSLIIAALLYTAGGTIRGFAVVLALGIVVGLLTTFLGTRTLLAEAMRIKAFKKYPLFAVENPEVKV